MRGFSYWLVWLIIAGAIFSGLLSLYLLDFGRSYHLPTHWRYYADHCSLLCADRGCVHPVQFPVLYARLVQPQIALLKQTGSYKLANLLVYFGLVPMLYAGWLVAITRRFRQKSSLLLTLFFGIIATVLAIYAVLVFASAQSPMQLYWGSTYWCVVQANRLHVSLPDVYTALFGVLIPVSVVLILGYFLMRFVRWLIRKPSRY